MRHTKKFSRVNFSEMVWPRDAREGVAIATAEEELDMLDVIGRGGSEYHVVD